MSNDHDDARSARIRGSIYTFITEAFIGLPDEEFLRRLKTPKTLKFLQNVKNLQNKKITSGIIHMENHIQLVGDENKQHYLESMAVDRTSLIRPVQKGKLKAPYEGLYSKTENPNTVILQVKKIYKRIGMLPHSAARDTEDFFCTELDFMGALCIMEAEGTERGMSALQREFLHSHLGSWIGDYCEAAIPLARTDFYKGLLMFLDGFIELEKQIVGEKPC